MRLANDGSSKKGLRKQRKQMYHQATRRLRDIEDKLEQAKLRQAQVASSSNGGNTMPKMKKKPRPVSENDGNLF